MPNKETNAPLTKEQISELDDVTAWEDNTLGNVHRLAFNEDDTVATLYEGNCIDGPAIQTAVENLRIVKGELEFTFQDTGNGPPLVTWTLTPLTQTTL